MPSEPMAPDFGRSIWTWISAATVSGCPLLTRSCCTRQCEETKAISAARTRSRRPGGSWIRCSTCQPNPARMPPGRGDPRRPSTWQPTWGAGINRGYCRDIPTLDLNVLIRIRLHRRPAGYDLRSRSPWGLVRGWRLTMNTTISRSAAIPPATTHARVDACAPVLAVPAAPGVLVVPAGVEVVAVTCCPGDGDVAVKENRPLTG